MVMQFAGTSKFCEGSVWEKDWDPGAQYKGIQDALAVEGGLGPPPEETDLALK
jgi:hypothetical protein